MKQLVRSLFSLLLPVVLVAGFSGTAMAAGTPAGTNILNRATIEFDIGTVTQPVVESSPGGNSTPGVGGGTDTDFRVDNRIDLDVTVQDGAPVQVIQGTSFGAGEYNVLTFRVTNEGNKVQDYALSLVAVTTGNNAAFGGTDDDNMAAPDRIFVNSAINTAGTYDFATDTATFIDELPPDSFFDVFVVLDAPGGLTIGDILSYHLVATTHTGGSAGGAIGALTVETGDSGDAWQEDTEQTVFADAGFNGVDDPGVDTGNDGKNSDQSDYVVVALNLTVAKAVTVWSDPILGIDPNAKAIPGAILTYIITVTNNGTADAVNMTITDDLDTQITAGNISFVTQFEAGVTCAAAEGIYVNGSSCRTNTNDGDNADFDLTTTNEVTVTGLSVAAGGGTATVEFQILITP